MKKQRIILQGKDADTHKHIPKVLNECLKRLKILLNVSKSNENEMITSKDQTLFETLEDSILLPIGTDINGPGLLIPYSSKQI